MTNRPAVAVRAFATTFTLALFAGCVGPSHGVPSSSTASAPHALDTAPVASNVEAPFPIPVIDLCGSGVDIGREHAQALGDGIRALHGRYIASYFRNPAARFVALTAASLFESKITPEHLSEIRALASYTSIDPRQMLLAQCFLDLAPITACSTITLPAAAAPDGVARFGRNLDFPSFDIADKASVVLIYHPAGHYAFASVAWPGMVGVLSGMNEYGLALANMEVRRSPRVPTAMPYTLLYRSVLEQCRTVEEAVAFLRKTPRQSANNLMLMDANGVRAVAELTPDAVTLRCGQDDAALISTNHQRGQEADQPGRCGRYDYLNRTSKDAFGAIDLEKVETMLAGAAQGKMTLQSMVFEPSTRVLYLSTGENAARGAFHRLDLKKHFDSPTGLIASAVLQGATSSSHSIR